MAPGAGGATGAAASSARASAAAAAGSEPVAGARSLAVKPAAFPGADGQPLVYPVPLFVRNTFIDCDDRPPSLEGFFKERRVASCPTSLLSSPGEKAAGEGHDSSSSAAWPAYPPEAALQRSKTVGNVFGNVRAQRSTDTVVTATSASADATHAADGGADQDGRSDCSTADTARSHAATGTVSPLSGSSRPLLAATSGAAGTTVSQACLPLEQEAQLLATGARGSRVLRLEDVIAQAAAFGSGHWHQLQPHTQQLPELPELPVPSATESHDAATPATAAQQLAVLDLPSMGSSSHEAGQCKPCAFMHSKGCKTGKACQFCHLCEPGEKKRRQKEKRAFFSTMRQLRQFAVDSFCSSSGTAQAGPAA